MVTRNAGSADSSRCIIRLCGLLLAAIFLSQTVAGCGPASQNSTPSNKQAASQKHGQTYGPIIATPTLPSSALHGPTNFLLRTPLDFSNVSGKSTDGGGTVTQLDAKTIKTTINQELKRFLFVVSSDDSVKVYSPGETSPIATHVTQRSDGSTAIDYTHTTNSVTMTFDAALYKDQIIARYEQQYSPLITESANATDVTVTFTTHLRWVTANQIPTAPENGKYQFTSNSGVSLSWSVGQNATTYDVYRLIPNHDQQFQLLGTVKDTAYSDKSEAHSTTGIAYAIFSVGPTGVENPSGTIISVPAH